jgi:SAM-dependent methyltransferase
MRIGRLAPLYRWIEYAAFGRAIERRRFAFLPRLAGARRVLIPGEGDGRVLARLLKVAPEARFDVFEASPEMIALARRRSGNSHRVRFFCDDARNAPWPAGHYDAVLTMFFLDCFTEQDARQVIRRIAGALKPGGLWLVGEFAVPPSGWRRLHARIWIAAMYRFFQVTTGLSARELAPIDRLLAEAEMVSLEREEARGGLLYSEVLTSVLTPGE